MLYSVALLRGDHRTVLQVEAPDFDVVLNSLIPHLADDSHISHADSAADMVHLAVLRHEVSRSQQAFNDAIARVQEEEARQEAMRIIAEDTPPGDNPGTLEP